MRDVQLRNEIFSKIERDALSSNRLQHEYNKDEVNAIMVSF